MPFGGGEQNMVLFASNIYVARYQEAVGQSDPSGSLWLTAFVLKSFAQADGLIYLDEAVLRDVQDWIRHHQPADGSFEPVGFLHHQQLLSRLQGNTALTD